MRGVGDHCSASAIFSATSPMTTLPAAITSRVPSDLGIVAVGLPFLVSGRRRRAPLTPSDLNGLFQETYNQLTESLMGTDHSWTTLTLKLCSAVETADKLVNCASSNAELLLEKVNMLESIIKRNDSAVEVAKAIQDAKAKEKMPMDG